MTRTQMIVAGIVMAAAVLVASIEPPKARACGGLFAPTSEEAVVTANRMALAISPTQTTLWSQIQYAGNPRDFVWVLPIAGTTLVELADNAFFEALERRTRIRLRGMFRPLVRTCPDPCAPPFMGAPDAGFTPPPFTPPPDDDVTVYGEATVGPYETVTVGSEDPEALLRWLQERGYAVPDAILPTIAHYVRLRMNFAVLRLAPNAGVNQMQPVRVTTPGLMPVLPLRMMSAGVADSVDIELYVFAEGRWHAQNFPTVEVDRDRLAYDWSTNSFNYESLFDAALTAAGGRGWVAEVALPFESWRWAVENYSSFDEDGVRHTPEADLAVVMRGLEAPFLTKLRTRLQARFLDQDLTLRAAETDATLESEIWVTREVNRPREPNCPTTCTRPPGGVTMPPGGRPGASGVAYGSDGRGDGLCAVTTSVPDGLPGTVVLLALAVGIATRSQRRGSPR
ncbi:MAG: DUF2330 domain-containing protein [Myxococcota bacterium]|nr:DUF2330 domain-containing protein [Myxococcota bacterium]